MHRIFRIFGKEYPKRFGQGSTASHRDVRSGKTTVFATRSDILLRFVSALVTIFRK